MKTIVQAEIVTNAILPFLIFSLYVNIPCTNYTINIYKYIYI